MPIPEPTRELVRRLKRAAVLLDSVAAVAKSDKAYTAANDAANVIWLAIDRIENLASALDDMVPSIDRAIDAIDTAIDAAARDMNNQ